MRLDKSNFLNATFFCCVALCGCFGSSRLLTGQEWTRFERQFPAMGVKVKIVAYANDQSTFAQAARTAEQRIDQLNKIFSNYIDDSEIAALSNRAPQMVDISNDLTNVATLAARIYRQSDGAFDASSGALTRVWRMARKRNRLPNPEKIEQARRLVGWSTHINLDIDARKASVSSPNVKLDFGGIAKGYAADQLLDHFRKHGLKRVLIEIGGDIAVGNAPPDTDAWTIAVGTGKRSNSQTLTIVNSAVATSGDANQFLIKDGVRYSHIIDPRTGNAVINGALVTVIADTCARADAFASALSVLSPEAAIQLAEKSVGVEARIAKLRPTEKTWLTQNLSQFIDKE